MSALAGLESLGRASLQGALFVGLVWLVCRLAPRLPASVRCGLWWAACLKLLLGLVWLAPVRLPLLPAAQASMPPAAVVLQNQNAPSPEPPVQIRPDFQTVQPGRSLAERAAPWLLGLWLAGLALIAVKAVRQLRHTRWVIRRSEPVGEGWIRGAFAELCLRLGLRRSPDLRGSADVRTPQAIGMLRPRVVLPRQGLETLSAPEISMTLCHELLHLRRGDLWLGWVPALAQRIFFFHPLAALAAREYVIAREAACDAEVLRVLGSAPQAYGRLLLRWGVAPRETGLAAAGASSSLENLKRRLQMLQQISDSRRRLSGWWWVAGAAALVALIPFRIVAQEEVPPEPPAAVAAPEAAPEVPGTPVAEPAEPAEAPEPPAVAEAVDDGIPGGVKGGVAGGVKGGVRGGVKGGVKGGVRGALPVVAPAPPGRPVPAPVAAPALPGLPALAPVAAPVAAPALPSRPVLAPVARVAPVPGVPAPPPVARIAGVPGVAAAPRAARQVPPVPPAPPAPPRPPVPPKHSHSGYSWSQHDDGESYVFLYGGDDDSATLSGSLSDVDRAKRLRGREGGEILWFRHGGKEYVVRDAATLKELKGLFKEQGELGRKQGELGAQQGQLGARQGELGGRQGALGAKQGALAAQRARRGGDEDDRDLDRQMDDLSRQMEALGRQQEELGRQQEALGRKQEELGRQQEAASARAEKAFRELRDRVIQNGTAKEVK